MLSKRTVVLGGGGGLAELALIGRAFEIRDTGKNDAEGQGPNEEGLLFGKITDEHGSAAADRAEQIQRQNGAAVAEAKIGKTVGCVVLPGRGEGQQPAPRAGNRDQR